MVQSSQSGVSAIKIDEKFSEKCLINLAQKDIADLHYNYQKTKYFGGLIQEYIPVEICTDRPIMLTEYDLNKKSNIRFLRTGCSYLLYNQDMKLELIFY